MSTLATPWHWPLFAALVVFSVGSAAAAQAPADDDDGPAVAAPRQPLYLVNEAMFNRLVFGNASRETVRTRFERVLTLKLADAERRYGLSEAQKARLALAGQGDLKRFFDRIDDRKVVLDKQVDQDEYVRLMQELRPLQTSLSKDLFGEGSFFFKALKTTLQEGQSARYGAAEHEALQKRYRARIDQVIVSLDSSLGLSAGQRRRLATLLVEETRPPRVFSAYDLQVVIYQMARLPEAKLRPIFDDAQWLALGRRFDQVRALKSILVSSGYLPEEAADPGQEPARPDAPRRER
jgi:hypothetical protein